MSRSAGRAADAAGHPLLWASRAGVAELAVLTRHVHRAWGLPRTALGRAAWPPKLGDRLNLRWNYWWQAHLLDCLVDAQLRAPTPTRQHLVERLIRGIKVRNLGWWTNEYYDDIAWMGLALMRAEQQLGIPVPGALDAIAKQLREGWTDHAGGGIWWRKRDTFKNVPANGPAAILLARLARVTGQRTDLQRARATVEWMEQRLADPQTGLLWDGLYINRDGSVRDVVRLVYTYCQGVFLGACVELAAEERSGPWLELAERTVSAVIGGATTDGVINGQGGGDGGLFAAILARYLAFAAPRLGRTAGGAASRLVYASAEAAWRNRSAGPGGPLFGPDWSKPAVAPRSAGERKPERDMSVQVGGWMVLEAAALLERA